MTMPSSPWGDAQGGVTPQGLQKMHAQQALFRGQLGLILRDLADEDVAGGDFGTDADDAAPSRPLRDSTLGMSVVISSSPSHFAGVDLRTPRCGSRCDAPRRGG